MSGRLPLASELPAGSTARVPGTDDVDALVGLLDAHRRSVGRTTGVDGEGVAATVTGPASWTRRQVVVEDARGGLSAWASVHDRAAGRTVVDLVVLPGHPDGDELAPVLLRWAAAAARDVAANRGLSRTLLDAGVHDGDERLRRWLAAAGYSLTRRWLHMSRTVAAGDAEAPRPRPGVVVRRVASHADGQPLAADLQVVHQMLEESFADHFNSYRESFPEFLQRLREDPGHRWDHWWIAEVDTDDGTVPGGALVSSVLPPDRSGQEGTYLDYIGVHRRSRGRGVAKALLHTVIRDAAERGRSRVDLEVDADSPTGAQGLYLSMGWETDYVTESWHALCETDPTGGSVSPA
jgi:GNAT superfamily N-acetyltransferase